MDNKKRKTLILIDMDGTIINFWLADNNIINQMYGKYKSIMFLDKILWKINGLDIISNNAFIFTLRILLYSILSLTNPFKAYVIYNIKYQEMVGTQINEELLGNLEYLKTLVDEVFIISHDFYTYGLKKMLPMEIIVKHKKRYIPNLAKKYDVKYIVGNNYMDDICSGKKLNKVYIKNGFKNRTKIIYIGKSKIIKKIVSKDIICFKDFKTCIGYLKNVVD